MLLFCSPADGSLGMQGLLGKTCPPEPLSGAIKHPIWVSALLVTLSLALNLKVSWEVKVPDEVKLQLLWITSKSAGTFEPGIEGSLLSFSTGWVQKYLSPFHQYITSLQLALQLKTTSLSSHMYTDCIQFKLVRSWTTQSPVNNYRIMSECFQITS